ncbi:MAG: DUF5615 family PIN-like protein [Bacteroidota bacterium]
MKILLDENLPRKLTIDFGAGFEVHTVRDMGWNGKKNGELLSLLAANNFDIFITLDKNLRHQQHLTKYNITVFLLYSVNNRLGTLQSLIKKVALILEKNNFDKFNEVR